MKQSVYMSTIASLSEAVLQFGLLVVPWHERVAAYDPAVICRRMLDSILSPNPEQPVLIATEPVVVVRRRWDEFCFRKLRSLAPRDTLVGEVHRGAESVAMYLAMIRQLGEHFDRLVGASGELSNVRHVVAELSHSRLTRKPLSLLSESTWREAELNLWRKAERSLESDNLRELIEQSVCVRRDAVALQFKLTRDDNERLNTIMSSEIELKARMDSRFIFLLRKWWDSSQEESRFQIAALALLLDAFGRLAKVPWVEVESDEELATYLTVHEPVMKSGDLRPLAWSCQRVARLASVDGKVKSLVEEAGAMADRLANAHCYERSAPTFSSVSDWFELAADSMPTSACPAPPRMAGLLTDGDSWWIFRLFDTFVGGDADWSEFVSKQQTIAGLLRHGPSSRVPVSQWVNPVRSRLACTLLDSTMGVRWRALLFAESKDDLRALADGYEPRSSMVAVQTLSTIALASLFAIVGARSGELDGVRLALKQLAHIERIRDYRSAPFGEELRELETLGRSVFAISFPESEKELAAMLASWTSPHEYPELATELLLLCDAPVFPGYGPAYGEPKRNQDMAWSGFRLEPRFLHLLYGNRSDCPKSCLFGAAFLVQSTVKFPPSMDWYTFRLWLSLTTESHPFERLRIEKYGKDQGIQMPAMDRDDNLSVSLNTGISDWINCTSLPSEELLHARVDRMARALWERREELIPPALRTP
jgi:hypothetical protein